jgi:hypothetical protein
MRASVSEYNLRSYPLVILWNIRMRLSGSNTPPLIRFVDVTYDGVIRSW